MSRMTVREMAEIFSRLDQDAVIEVATGRCSCGDVSCADFVGRPVLVEYESGEAYGRHTYVIQPNISYQLTRKVPDTIRHTDEAAVYRQS